MYRLLLPPMAVFPPGGLAGLFNNPTYGDIFSAFSPLRLFSPGGQQHHRPCSSSLRARCPNNIFKPATVRGFGAVFTDVDLPDGIGPREKHGTIAGPVR